MNERKQDVKLFEESKVRTVWDEEKEEWYFSVEDVVFALTDSNDTKQYIKKMRKRDEELNSNWGTICTHVQMKAKDGKNRKIMASDTKGILRIIQSIPSPKAEPFKLWLAQVGSERIEEIQDPEKAIDRAMQYYLNKGYSKEWINQRLKSIEVRKDLTNEWDRVGVKGTEYAILTDIITEAWSGMKTKDYKNFKGLHKESLRDNMTNMELVLNMLAEASTTEISKQRNPKTMQENKQIAKRGGTIAGNARKQLELETGKDVVSDENYLSSKNVKKIQEKKD